MSSFQVFAVSASRPRAAVGRDPSPRVNTEPTVRAGLPATISPGATSLATTAPATMRAVPNAHALTDSHPTETSLPIQTGLTAAPAVGCDARWPGSGNEIVVHDERLRPDHRAVADVDGAAATRMAPDMLTPSPIRMAAAGCVAASTHGRARLSMFPPAAGTEAHVAAQANRRLPPAGNVRNTEQGRPRP